MFSANRKLNFLGLLTIIVFSECPAAFGDELRDSVSDLLESEFAKSTNSISDTLLQPLPSKSEVGISIKYPEQKYLLSVGQQRLPPVRLEASYNKNITLTDALKTAYVQSLPIKISSEFFKSRKALFVGALGRFLPDLSMTYRAQEIYQSGLKVASVKTSNTTLTWAYFQGGKVLSNALGSYYDMNSAKGGLSASINDVLLDTYRKYNDVLYNQALLQIRIKSLETSRANLKLTKDQFKAGVGTKFAIMQSESQLATDVQNLLNQQVATRKSAIALAVAMNNTVSENLLPSEESVQRAFIVDPKLNAQTLTSIAFKNRPELKQLENQRLAARAAIGIAASPLFPTAQIFVSPSNTTINSSSSSSTNASSTSAVSGVNLSTTGTGTTSIGVGGVIGESVTLGTSLTWNLSGLGVYDGANVASARHLARRATEQYRLRQLEITQEVRNSFLDMQTAEQQIDIANVNVKASREGLRLAYKRLEFGNGTNLELIQSQQTYVNALASQIKAYIDFNNSQALVLRNTGTISITALAQEFRN